MRAFRTILSLAMMFALLTAMTPIVAGGARERIEARSQRVDISAEGMDVRDVGTTEMRDQDRPPSSLNDDTVDQGGLEHQQQVPGEILVKLRTDTAQAMDSRASLHARGGGSPGSWVDRGREVLLVEVDEDTSIDEAVVAYESQPEVEWAQPNYVYTLSATPNDTMFGWLDSLHNVGQKGGSTDADIDAPAAWELETGSSSVVVAVIDTGIDETHADLSGNLWFNTDETPGNGLDDDSNGYVDDIYGWDFVNTDADPSDSNSHGTHVAGTIGALGNDGGGVAGVAWDVSLMALKAFNEDTTPTATTDDLVEAIEYADDNGADVINASWGQYVEDPAIESAIAAADLLFVAAAGNNGLDNDTMPFYPASFGLDNIIAVAATDNKDALASFSNYGTSTVDVAAPGVDVLSTIPDGLAGTIFYDAFPTSAGWKTSDYNKKPWTLTSARTGSFSGVPAIGNLDYSANEEAYLDLKYPVDLSQSSAAWMWIDLSLGLEPGYDYLVPLASTDGGTSWDAIDDVAYTGATSSTERLAGSDRYSTAVRIAREGWGGGGSNWTGVKDIIIASGEDWAAADPLSASGLSWVYDAPLFLVSSRSTPSAVKTAVREIAADNGKVNVHIVGGTRSVPSARYNDLAAAVKGVGSVTYDRVAGSDRYSTAEKIAGRVISKYKTENGGAKPPVVLVANGSNPASFYDALALSPIAANNGYPILPVTNTSVPAATNRVLNTIDPQTAIIGGGTAVVSSGVASQIDRVAGSVQRWSGADRYKTAATIAANAVSSKWGFLDASNVAVASGLPDALTGGSMVGSQGGPLVLTAPKSLTSTTRSWIKSRSNSIDNSYMLGGTSVLHPNIQEEIAALIAVWVADYLDLGAYIGESRVDIAFVLVSDSSENYRGVFIDDVQIDSVGGYGLNSGTSMAAPHVSGMAALLKASDGTLSPVEMKQAIIDSVDAKSSLSGKVASGGRANAHGALMELP